MRTRGLIVSTADACAIGCRFCFRADVGRDVLALETYTRALSRLREVGAEELCLSGGEPTDHPDFGRLVRVALQFGYRCSVVTAARSGRRLDALVDVAGMLSHITVSADSRRADELGHTGRTVASTAIVFKAIPHDRVSLHLTAYDLSEDDLADIASVRAVRRVPVEVSPLLPSRSFRFDNPALARDVDLIATHFGLSPNLSSLLAEYREWMTVGPTRSCRADRLYLSADGYVRRCPYQTAGQANVHNARAELRATLERMWTGPPTPSLSCLAICRPADVATAVGDEGVTAGVYHNDTVQV